MFSRTNITIIFYTTSKYVIYDILLIQFSKVVIYIYIDKKDFSYK